MFIFVGTDRQLYENAEMSVKIILKKYWPTNTTKYQDFLHRCDNENSVVPGQEQTKKIDGRS